MIPPRGKIRMQQLHSFPCARHMRSARKQSIWNSPPRYKECVRIRVTLPHSRIPLTHRWTPAKSSKVESKSANARSRLRRLQLIQRQVQPQNIDPGLTDQPKKAALDGGLDQLPQFAFVETTRLGDGRDLCERRLRRDVGVKTRGRRRHSVRRNRSLARLRAPRLDARLDAIGQLLRGRAEVRAGGIGCVVRRVDRLGRIVGIGVGRRRGARME